MVPAGDEPPRPSGWGKAKLVWAEIPRLVRAQIAGMVVVLVVLGVLLVAHALGGSDEQTSSGAGGARSATSEAPTTLATTTTQPPTTTISTDPHIAALQGYVRAHFPDATDCSVIEANEGDIAAMTCDGVDPGGGTTGKGFDIHLKAPDQLLTPGTGAAGSGTWEITDEAATTTYAGGAWEVDTTSDGTAYALWSDTHGAWPSDAGGVVMATSTFDTTHDAASYMNRLWLRYPSFSSGGAALSISPVDAWSQFHAES